MKQNLFYWKKNFRGTILKENVNSRNVLKSVSVKRMKQKLILLYGWNEELVTCIVYAIWAYYTER